MTNVEVAEETDITVDEEKLVDPQNPPAGVIHYLFNDVHLKYLEPARAHTCLRWGANLLYYVLLHSLLVIPYAVLVSRSVESQAVLHVIFWVSFLTTVVIRCYIRSIQREDSKGFKQHFQSVVEKSFFEQISQLLRCICEYLACHKIVAWCEPLSAFLMVPWYPLKTFFKMMRFTETDKVRL